MNTIKENIANTITLLNLFCGLFAILYALGGHLNIAGGLIILGAFFDFFDGLVARALKVESELGKQLDSFADLITFGVATGIVVFQLLFLLETNLLFNPVDSWKDKTIYSPSYIPYIAFLIPLFSALRLARFNIDTNKTNTFIGLPTPANSLFFISIPLIMHFQSNHFLLEYITNIKVLIPIIIFFCFFMTSKIPLLSLKFDAISWKKNKLRYVFIFLSLLLLFQFLFVAIPIIILLYIILSILNNYIT